jgi:ligand-binding sensor domain-containing protein
LKQDAAGNLLIASDSGVEKLTLDNSGTVVPDSIQVLSRERSYGICKDPSGTVWVKVRGQYAAIESDGFAPAASKGIQLPKGIIRMSFADDGRAFSGSFDSLGLSENGNYYELMPLVPWMHQSFYSLAAKDGTFWFQQADELVEIREGQLIHHDLKGYVTGGSRAMLFDDEGNIWIATQSDGLVRLTRRSVELVSDLTDMEIAGINSIAEDKDGSVWLGGAQLFKVKDRTVTEVTKEEHRGGFVKSLAVDGNGVLWVLANIGLFRMEDENLVRVPEPGYMGKEFHALFFDSAWNLWIGSTTGLGRLAPDGQYIEYTTDNGLVDNGVHFITQTHDGTLWIGTMRGISKFKDGKFENITAENGLPAGYVRDIEEDNDGTIWIATYGGGIVRLRGGRDGRHPPSGRSAK